MAIKPILFNTEMVREILDGRKVCTRRLPRKQIEEKYLEYDEWVQAVAVPGCTHLREKEFYMQYPPYQPEDILYVRETWERFECWNCDGDERGNCQKEPKKSVLDKTFGCYMYRATDEISGDAKWKPSIHMPKEAARIWLKVTDVRVERLQEITEAQAEKEGFIPQGLFDGDEITLPATYWFSKFWNFTIKKSDLDRYGWAANPWVWAIEFERCEKPERETEEV